MRNVEFGIRNPVRRASPRKGGGQPEDAPSDRKNCFASCPAISHSAFRIPHFQRRSVTLVELMLVLVVIGIVFGLAVPTPAESRDLKVLQGARMLAADIEYAENESIAHPDAPRVIKVNISNNTYWIGTTAAPDTPVTDPISGGSYLVSFGTGRGAGLSSMTIQSYSLGGDAVIGFDAYGVPDQSTTATIVLQCGGATKTIQVAAGTGEVTIP